MIAILKGEGLPATGPRAARTRPGWRRRMCAGVTGSAARLFTGGKRSSAGSMCRTRGGCGRWEENARLKRLLADAKLDNAMLKDIAGEKW